MTRVNPVGTRSATPDPLNPHAFQWKSPAKTVFHMAWMSNVKIIKLMTPRTTIMTSLRSRRCDRYTYSGNRKDRDGLRMGEVRQMVTGMVAGGILASPQADMVTAGSVADQQ